MLAKRAILVCGKVSALVKGQEEPPLIIALAPKNKRRNVTIPFRVPFIRTLPRRDHMAQGRNLAFDGALGLLVQANVEAPRLWKEDRFRTIQVVMQPPSPRPPVSPFLEAVSEPRQPSPPCSRHRPAGPRYAAHGSCRPRWRSDTCKRRLSPQDAKCRNRTAAGFGHRVRSARRTRLLRCTVL